LILSNTNSAFGSIAVFFKPDLSKEETREIVAIGREK